MGFSQTIRRFRFSQALAMMIVAVFTSISTLAIAFLLRFLFALLSDIESASVAPHLRVEIHDEAPPQVSETAIIAG
jgi:hypothetical protein